MGTFIAIHEARLIKSHHCLSPILYVFYNANLVQGQINKREGSIGFIDDYNAWVVGPSAAENTRRLQTQLLPRAEKWARESGAVFEAQKTALITSFARCNQIGGRRTTWCSATRRLRQSKG